MVKAPPLASQLSDLDAPVQSVNLELVDGLVQLLTNNPSALDLVLEQLGHERLRSARQEHQRRSPDRLNEQQHDQGSSADGISLSPRELEIVRLVAKGLPNKSIADILEISPWTVATHLRRIFTKLSVGTRAAMIARSIEMHLL
jgi:DNA-binding CsgD family transcriptional regulator